MRALWIALVLAACGGGQPLPRQPGIPIEELTPRVRPAIVQVEAGGTKTGVGFVVDKAGIVATTLRIVAGESAIVVRLPGGAQYPVTQIAGIDAGRNLALLRVQPAGELPALALGTSKPLSAGAPVTAASKSERDGLSLFNTLISQVRPVCDPEAITAGRCKQELTVLQFSLPERLPDGSFSGAPLFDQRGEAVGLISGLLAHTSTGVAIPCDYLKLLTAQPTAMALDEFARSTGRDAVPTDLP